MRKKTYKEPNFSLKDELARYVNPDEIMSGGRVSSGAFMPSPIDVYLSVNSLELESIRQIAAYYRETLHQDGEEVAVACRKIEDYNHAARVAGISVRKNSVSDKWEFDGPHGISDAYKHRPNRRSVSHCGVEFIRTGTDEMRLKKIARRLAGRKPRLLKTAK